MDCELAALQGLTQGLECGEQLEFIFFLQINALSYEAAFWHLCLRESSVQKKLTPAGFLSNPVLTEQKKKKKALPPAPTHTSTVPNKGSFTAARNGSHEEMFADKTNTLNPPAPHTLFKINTKEPGIVDRESWSWIFPPPRHACNPLGTARKPGQAPAVWLPLKYVSKSNTSPSPPGKFLGVRSTVRSVTVQLGGTVCLASTFLIHIRSGGGAKSPRVTKSHTAVCGSQSLCLLAIWSSSSSSGFSLGSVA